MSQRLFPPSHGPQTLFQRPRPGNGGITRQEIARATSQRVRARVIGAAGWTAATLAIIAGQDRYYNGGVALALWVAMGVAIFVLAQRAARRAWAPVREATAVVDRSDEPSAPAGQAARARLGRQVGAAALAAFAMAHLLRKIELVASVEFSTFAILLAAAVAAAFAFHAAKGSTPAEDAIADELEFKLASTANQAR